MGPFITTKWLVCHGSGAVHLVELSPGSVLVTGQQTTESFDISETALTRATALGYVES